MRRIRKTGMMLLCVVLCFAMMSACTAKEQTAGSNATASATGETSADANASANADANTNTDNQRLSGDATGGSNATESNEASDVTSSAGTKTEPAQMSLEKDMGISVGGQWYPIWQDAEKLLQALGDDYELYSAQSCVFDGEDKEFAYDGLCVFTNPNGERDNWYSILLENDEYSTARGIHVGCALDEVVAAYGDRYYWEGEDILTYSISGEEGDISSPCILFTVAQESISSIEIYYPTNVS